MSVVSVVDLLVDWKCLQSNSTHSSMPSPETQIHPFKHFICWCRRKSITGHQLPLEMNVYVNPHKSQTDSPHYVQSDLVICKQRKEYGRTWHQMSELRLRVTERHKALTHWSSQEVVPIPWTWENLDTVSFYICIDKLTQTENTALSYNSHVQSHDYGPTKSLLSWHNNKNMLDCWNKSQRYHAQ